MFLNSKPIYAGNNTIGSREPNFLGLLNADNDSVYLPLKKGENELVLAVTEFFGAGVSSVSYRIESEVCKLHPKSTLSTVAYGVVHKLGRIH